MTKKIYRNKDKAIFAGVCSGLADYFDIDATLVRIIFVILAFGGGSGVLIYLVLWLVIPSDGENNSDNRKEESIRDFADDVGKKVKSVAKEINKEVRVEKRQGNFLGLILMFLGIVLLIDKVIPMVIRWDYVWPIVLIVLGGYLFYGRSK